MQSTLEAVDTDLITETELLVVWQQPKSRAMIPVGVLSFDGVTYRFEYLPSASGIADFRNLMGFKDFKKKYESDELFPLFRDRVFDPTRPDFVRVVEELQLTAESATPWEQLVRTGGSSEGDTLQLTPVPRRSETGWTITALVAGVRYMAEKQVETAEGIHAACSPDELLSLLEGLQPGEPLSVSAEIGNPYNEDAQLLLTSAGRPIGYLPDWLAKLASPHIDNGGKAQATVTQVNGPAAGWHLRVLFKLEVDERIETVQEQLYTTVSSY